MLNLDLLNIYLPDGDFIYRNFQCWQLNNFLNNLDWDGLRRNGRESRETYVIVKQVLKMVELYWYLQSNIFPSIKHSKD